MPQRLKLPVGGIKSSDNHEDDDAATVIGDGDPAVMMYMPEEGSFYDESSTLFEGSSGSRASNFKKQRQASVSTPAFKASMKQLHYNENRVALDRSINQTIELLYELSDENKQRPVFFPTESTESENVLLNSPRAHLALVRRNTDLASKTVAKAKMGYLGPDGDDRDDDDDFGVTTADFKVLKLNLKMGHDSKVISSLDKKSVSGLFEQKLTQQVKYLLNLKDRVDDTSSKVFVTGDLNAGKSTFCNALLKRKLLPEDQQPCTSVFCEVIDAKGENNGIEEVHAVTIGSDYDQRDKSTYETHSLKELEDLVYECDKYSLLKVYVLEYRTADESLLGNGVIDIKLIDAPGLNMDSYQTTQVFSRQEEIDLVVFVVNSENHFTLSAKEFIAAAAAEKRYVFIVVNKFDNIRDKNKCMNKILDQVKSLSPDTYKDAKDFVHFVSSSDALSEFPDGGDGPGDDDGPGDNEPHYADPNFDNLEASLRKFILDKRSISKLLPAKNYLLNLLGDLKTLSEINEKIYLKEAESKNKTLKDTITPKYDLMVQNSLRVNDNINKLMEKTCSQVYDATRREILSTVENFGSSQIVPYLGFQYAYEYAKETQRRMIETIMSSVQKSEENARVVTGNTVQEIITFGQLTLGDEFLADKKFKSDLMFTRRRDTIKKQLNDLIEVTDFFDPSIDSVLMWLGVPQEFISSSRELVQYFSPVLVLSSVPTSVASLKRLLPTQLTLHTLYSSTKLITTGALIRKAYTFSSVLKPSVIKHTVVPILLGVGGFAIFYLINDIPNAYPRKQARRLKKQVIELDYAHVNADRISKECRLVLNFPARQVMNNFQTSIDKRSGEKEKLEKEIKNAEISSGYFLQMLAKVSNQQNAVENIDLESIYVVD
ncbi:CIC11C00000003082 [Sungouiella intermedia]|uniref:CIC11C00000003082 n=1 Tax=Sungouiella intermedia TaxID=45354 RepID=A0A1L0CWT3_9ASCO|nr:CIC11C00000003082 [[Candida] intermedia]